MLDRVTGGDAQAKAAYLATVPQQRAGQPDEIAAAIAWMTQLTRAYWTCPGPRRSSPL